MSEIQKVSEERSIRSLYIRIVFFMLLFTVVCVNVYVDDPRMCDIWASAGECEKNPWWMSRYCARSCKVCLPDSTAGHTVHSTTAGSAVGSTAGGLTGEFTRNMTSTRLETTVAQTRAAPSPVLFTDTTAVQSAAGSSEKAAASSSTTAMPSAVQSVTSGENMEEQVTFLYSTAVPPPTAAPVTVGSRSVQPTTAGHPPEATTAGSGSVKPTTAANTGGEDVTGYGHTESKRDVGSTKEPTLSGKHTLVTHNLCLQLLVWFATKF